MYLIYPHWEKKRKLSQWPGNFYLVFPSFSFTQSANQSLQSNLFVLFSFEQVICRNFQQFCQKKIPVLLIVTQHRDLWLHPPYRAVRPRITQRVPSLEAPGPVLSQGGGLGVLVHAVSFTQAVLPLPFSASKSFPSLQLKSCLLCETSPGPPGHSRLQCHTVNSWLIGVLLAKYEAWWSLSKTRVQVVWVDFAYWTISVPFCHFSLSLSDLFFSSFLSFFSFSFKYEETYPKHGCTWKAVLWRRELIDGSERLESIPFFHHQNETKQKSKMPQSIKSRELHLLLGQFPKACYSLRFWEEKKNKTLKN